jgi:hypothetical protein
MSTDQRIAEILSLIDRVLDETTAPGRSRLADDELGADGVDLHAEAA